MKSWYEHRVTLYGDNENGVKLGGHWTSFEGSGLLAERIGRTCSQPSTKRWGSKLMARCGFHQCLLITGGGKRASETTQSCTWLDLERNPIGKRLLGFYGHDVFLQKRDGSLWRWGDETYSSKTNWPGLRTLPVIHLVEGSNWPTPSSRVRPPSLPGILTGGLEHPSGCPRGASR